MVVHGECAPRGWTLTATAGDRPTGEVSGATGGYLGRVPTGWFVFAGVAIWLLSGVYMFHFGGSWHLDLRVYRDAGHTLFHGGNAYVGTFTANGLPFTYPPFALLVLSPLSLGPLGAAESGWWVVGAVAMVAATYLVVRASLAVPPRRALAWAAFLGGVCSLALEPLRSNFDYGQIETVLILFVVADLTRVSGRCRGMLVGAAAAIKLTPLIFIFYFAACRDWRSLARSVATFAFVTAASWAILPSESTRYWLHEAFVAGRTGPLGGVSNQSWNGVVHRPPFHGGQLETGVWLALSIITLVGGVLLAYRLVAENRRVEAMMALALTEQLVSPVSWTHHWTWLVFAPIIAARLWPDRRAVAVAWLVLFSVGVAAPYLWRLRVPFAYLTANSLALCAAVLLVLWAVVEWRAPTPVIRSAPAVTVPPGSGLRRRA